MRTDGIKIARQKSTKVEFTWDGEDGSISCLLYTSDAADERSSVDLGGRRSIKKKKYEHILMSRRHKVTLKQMKIMNSETTRDCRTAPCG